MSNKDHTTQQPISPYHFPYMQQTPLINANDLKEDEEIVFEYDKNGNLRSVRKTRRPQGCFSTIAVIIVTAGILWGIAQMFA